MQGSTMRVPYARNIRQHAYERMRAEGLPIEADRSPGSRGQVDPVLAWMPPWLAVLLDVAADVYSDGGHDLVCRCYTRPGVCAAIEALCTLNTEEPPYDAVLALVCAEYGLPLPGGPGRLRRGARLTQA